jgi:hypothetical protein
MDDQHLHEGIRVHLLYVEHASSAQVPCTTSELPIIAGTRIDGLRIRVNLGERGAL